MGNVRVTQSGVEVLASPDSAVRVTQEGVQVLADGAPNNAGNIRVTQEGVEVLAAPESSVRVTQEAIEVLANPPGTITVDQAGIDVLASPPSNVVVTQQAVTVLSGIEAQVQATQIAIQILADFESVPLPSIQLTQTCVQVLADCDDSGGDGPHVTPPRPPGTLTDTLTTIRSLRFTPFSKTKYLILAQCAAGVTYNAVTDACQTVLGQSALVINGYTAAFTDIGNMQTYACYDATPGTEVLVELKAKRLQSGGNDSAYCARIAAIGLDEWYRIEQGVEDTLTGPTTTQEKVLMEDYLAPTYGECLIFNYAEMKTDEVQGLRNTYTVEMDSPNLRLHKPIDVVLQQKSGYREDFPGLTYSPSSRWSCVSSVGSAYLHSGTTSIRYKTAKLDNEIGEMEFRRLRTVIIPLSRNPIGAVHQQFAKGNLQITGNQSESITMSPRPRTVTDYKYLVLGSVKTHVETGTTPTQTVFRYTGLGMVGGTTNLVGLSGLFQGVAATTAMYAAGITFGIQNDDILAIKTYNFDPTTASNTGYNGEQYFGFNLVTATQTAQDNYYFFSTTQYQDTEEVVSKTGDKFMAVVLLPKQGT